MNFKWSINKVTVAEDNLVVKVDLTVTATDGDNTASAAYTRTLARGDSFIPYDQLTEAQVLAWCFEPVVTTWTDMDDVEQTSIAGKIDRQLAQVAAEPALPWVAATEASQP